MDVLSPFNSVRCHSDWLFHGESCPRLDVVHPGCAWSSSPVYLALFLALSLSPGNSLVSSWCDHSMLVSLLSQCLTVPSLLQLCWVAKSEGWAKIFIPAVYYSETAWNFHININNIFNVFNYVYMPDKNLTDCNKFRVKTPSAADNFCLTLYIVVYYQRHVLWINGHINRLGYFQKFVQHWVLICN